MSDCINVVSGQTTVSIPKDKISAAALQTEGVISLWYQDADSNPKIAYIAQEQHPIAYQEALAFLAEVDGGYNAEYIP